MSPETVSMMRMASQVYVSLERVGIAGLPHKARTQSNVVTLANAMKTQIRPTAVKHQMVHKEVLKSPLWP